MSAVGECRICHCYGVMDTHHMLHGSSRKQADEDGITCLLCRRCHSRLHDQGEHDLELKKEGERIWLRKTGGTIAQFRRRYGKNYLDDEEET